ncbi:hypothetical protein ASPVEDRAFT_683715 [Aspergillus versicolor CBS 583.65]|uniref:Uncharacterized protein n=1 Tax=Aspergillus versicolor CBS 583.65 TaxID=1036611 RepID=A0A1L9PM52_ASPVE|nr:uncharacterized protein ASPVEDRAFT_683715 [Aspergillus versicolor CBS 583.65]OJJ02581.1 hypothetical protein ASPVEDRAFT_683715 [Aspergillus versicolor CBS 583.65]
MQARSLIGAAFLASKSSLTLTSPGPWLSTLNSQGNNKIRLVSVFGLDPTAETRLDRGQHRYSTPDVTSSFQAPTTIESHYVFGAGLYTME